MGALSVMTQDDDTQHNDSWYTNQNAQLNDIQHDGTIQHYDNGNDGNGHYDIKCNIGL